MNETPLPRRALDAAENVLYETASVCPLCAVVERRGFHWIPAQVEVERVAPASAVAAAAPAASSSSSSSTPSERVALVSFCSKHGERRVPYCGDVAFFRRMLSYEPGLSRFMERPVHEMTVPELPGLLRYTPDSQNLPAIVEMSIVRGGALVSRDTLAAEVAGARRMYASGQQCAFRARVSAQWDAHELNDKLLELHELCTPQVVLVESTYDVLLALVHLERSVFLKSRFFPSLRFYVRPGDEPLFVRQTGTLVDAVSQIRGAKLFVTVCVDSPFPDLKIVLDYLRSCYKHVNVVSVVLERSPVALVRRLVSEQQQQQQQGASQAVPSELYDVDPMPLLRAIAQACGNLRVDDLLPMSAGMVLEPFLRMLGYPVPFVRPAPFDAFVSIFVNTDERFKSEPLAKLLDLPRLYKRLLKHQDALYAAQGQVGVMLGLKLKKVFRRCMLPGVKLPDVLDHLRDEDRRPHAMRTLSHAQLLLVHNYADFACVDIRRRVHCAIVAPSSTAEGGYASAALQFV